MPSRGNGGFEGKKKSASVSLINEYEKIVPHSLHVRAQLAIGHRIKATDARLGVAIHRFM
jgi:hypothetical protein